MKAAKHGICLNTVFDPLEKERRAYRSNAQDIRVPTVSTRPQTGLENVTRPVAGERGCGSRLALSRDVASPVARLPGFAMTNVEGGNLNVVAGLPSGK